MRHRYLLWDDKLRLLSLLAFFYAYSSPIRVAVRSAVEGREFRWGYPSGIKPDGDIAMAWGHGLAGHTGYVLYLACGVAVLLSLALRAPNRIVDVAIVAWTSIGLGVGTWLSNELGAELVSEKATLGFSGLSYFWAEVLPVAIAWALAVIVLLRSLFGREAPGSSAWKLPNTASTLAGVSFVAVAAALFNVGPPHGAGDLGGIVALYIGLLLLFVALSPWGPADVSPAAVAGARVGHMAVR